ncbi:RNA-binding protein [Caenimonas terrae]|uniref:RNA-binding protein n=1 Tax=Caenimonas terrae TaxID=696074 RepID=A0ABW0NKM0_9BURK
MKHFELEPSMLTMRGVFYPTGYMVVMLPSEQDARAAERKLEENGVMGEKVALLSPDVIQEKIARTVGSADIPLPTVGTEADTVRRFAELASQGHWALMIHAPHGDETTQIMEILKAFPLSYGQKYRQLVIEDLVD